MLLGHRAHVGANLREAQDGRKNLRLSEAKLRENAIGTLRDAARRLAAPQGER
jgi:hypothetical protein